MNPRLDFYKASPGVLAAMRGLEAEIAKSGLDKPLCELVRLRASQINGCAYCIDMHATDARKGGETQRRLDTLPAWRETAFFTPRERAALAWTEALTLIAQTHAPDDVYSGLRDHFSEKEIVDLTLLITTINSWNRFAIGFRKQPD